jgi:hypothetical protein
VQIFGARHIEQVCGKPHIRKRISSLGETPHFQQLGVVSCLSPLCFRGELRERSQYWDGRFTLCPQSDTPDMR